jgi:alanine racemase
MADPTRWAWADIDLSAIAHNTMHMRTAAGVPVWSVVKANGYGHGAVPVAEAALAAGASGLCVALVDEGVELRNAGIDAPILVLSEPPLIALERAAQHRLDVTLYRPEAIAAAGDIGGLRVHLKLDTGMARVGAPIGEVVTLASVIDRHPSLELASVWTHLAMSDEPDDPFTAQQLDRYAGALDALATAGITVPISHAANSGGAMAHDRARGDVVRVGIATYGIEPGTGVRHLSRELQPALALRARVSLVKRVEAGTGVSYGQRHRFATATTVATLPLGYADGVPRRLFATGGQVLLHGERCPIVGVVTMDQLMVDVGDLDVSVGDVATLIGRDGDAEIRAEELAERLDTIGYEIVCGISARIPRLYS